LRVFTIAVLILSESFMSLIITSQACRLLYCCPNLIFISSRFLSSVSSSYRLSWGSDLPPDKSLSSSMDL
jgi:hypothetical protein